MEQESRLSTWLAAVYRCGYEAHVRFWCDFYGGVPAAKAAEIAELERNYQDSSDTTESTP